MHEQPRGDGLTSQTFTGQLTPPGATRLDVPSAYPFSFATCIIDREMSRRMTDPGKLPEQATSFVGRKHEIAEIKRLLGGCRLLTLAGTGGVGKTRLALKIASSANPRYRGGVWFVDLTSVANSSFVPATVASSLGLDERPDWAPEDRLLDHLEHVCERTLLVLDNCEHVIEACAQLAHLVLEKCPQVSILATSRQPLNIAGECVWRVASLPFPSIPEGEPFQSLSRCESVQLFVERARFKRPGFRLSSENASSITQICSQLEGLPLAIELAAARVSVLSVDQILERLAYQHRLLAGGNYAATERHRTLQAVVDWSYGLLSEQEKQVFRALSVFAGGFQLEAVMHICGQEMDEYETIELLSLLEDKSLLLVEEQHGETRYRMLETLRQYGAERLNAANEAPRVMLRHLNWCLQLAECAEAKMQSPEQADWLRRLDVENDNLRAALHRALDSRQPEIALRLVGALGRFWIFRNHLREGRQWVAAALGACDEHGPGEEVIPTAALVKALNVGAIMALGQADYGEARSLHSRCLQLRREIGDKDGVARSLTNLGVVEHAAGEYTEALRLGREALLLFRELNSMNGISSVLNNLGESEYRLGNLEEARALFEECLAIKRETGDIWGIADALRNLGHIARMRGDLVAAGTRYAKALGLFHDLGDRLYMSSCLEGLAGLAAQTGDALRAAELLAVCSAVREDIGSPLQSADLPEHELTVAAIRAQLGETDWQAAWSRGRATMLEDAVSRTLAAWDVAGATPRRKPQSRSIPARLVAPSPTSPLLTALSRREHEVLQLLAEGLTDAQIASVLSVSRNTVNTHTRKIYRKLGVNSRMAATRYAAEHGLLDD